MAAAAATGRFFAFAAAATAATVTVFSLFVATAAGVAATAAAAATGQIVLGRRAHVGDFDVEGQINTGKRMVGVESNV